MVSDMTVTVKSREVQRGKQKIAGAIAGKHAAGAIRTVRARRQAQNEELGVRIAKSRYGFAPVFPLTKGAALFSRHFFAVHNQPRTSSTGNNFAVQRMQSSFWIR